MLQLNKDYLLEQEEKIKREKEEREELIKVSSTRTNKVEGCGPGTFWPPGFGSRKKTDQDPKRAKQNGYENHS